jgi:Arc/MetJ family transcription regulator
MTDRLRPFAPLLREICQFHGFNAEVVRVWLLMWEDICDDMGTHMKTTIEIADALLARAKRVAANEHITLRELVETGLRQVLAQRQTQRPFTFRDQRVRGRGLQPEFQTAAWAQIRDAAYAASER